MIIPGLRQPANTLTHAPGHKLATHRSMQGALAVSENLVGPQPPEVTGAELREAQRRAARREFGIHGSLLTFVQVVFVLQPRGSGALVFDVLFVAPRGCRPALKEVPSKPTQRAPAAAGIGLLIVSCQLEVLWGGSTSLKAVLPAILLARLQPRSSKRLPVVIGQEEHVVDAVHLVTHCAAHGHQGASHELLCTMQACGHAVFPQEHAAPCNLPDGAQVNPQGG
mmetsp:Transcript_30759/g.84496  ORF Transcript_30759/g.84496 Transcript_30759/m.84496 type:complete len:224 (-) Transcript_30759:306-977(-)